ncbi:MAG: TAXI family TRAP transporter solute-binding subunit [Rhodobiaceae bacterium]|nr:TAXI family TRAP transporter solute-binding subunit [Rhodobiaceae bacterium]MCC0050376.1 TAXI family TRAP transporter solute-binding subunit [Rhodobiaceae bacterium]MCC0061115.1 TAXI family TRAP transporter solute-binding subunit [Rhodobiaceae bacterium]
MTDRRSVLRGAAAAFVGAAMAATALSTPVRAQDAQDYLLATASTGGTYYPVGVALATLVKVKLQPKDKINMSAISSAGSGENVKLIRENEAQFAILQGLFGAYAAKGTGPIANDGPQEHLRSITMLWPNVEHFIVKKEYAKTGTISDMMEVKGKSVGLGAKNSGTIGSNRTILGNLGIDIEKDYELMYAGYGPTADAMQNGQVDAISTPAGPPVGAVSKLFATMADKVTLLSFTPEQAKEANGDFEDLWVPFVIKGGTYPGLDKDVTTVAQPNFLAVRDSVPEETVYKITKTIYENLPFLQGIHKATNAMSLESAIAGLPVKLHPGAVRYYEEAGIQIPDRLK